MAGVTLENVFFPAAGDSVQLNAWYFTQPEAQGTILFFGGNGFYLVQSRGYIEALTGFPVNVLMMDYRGYGQSGGTPSVEALKADAYAAYRYLIEKRGVDPERLVVHGHSLGTFLALGLADQSPVAGVVLENPLRTSRRGPTTSCHGRCASSSRSNLPKASRARTTSRSSSNSPSHSWSSAARRTSSPTRRWRGRSTRRPPPRTSAW
ncbi:MAG: alpha/beta hydrolase [Rhodothermales bacterium]